MELNWNGNRNELEWNLYSIQYNIYTNDKIENIIIEIVKVIGSFEIVNEQN